MLRVSAQLSKSAGDHLCAEVPDNQMAGGAAAIVLGLLALTVQYTMAATHTWGGINYADAFHASMTILGSASLILGAGLVWGGLWKRSRVGAELLRVIE